MDHVAFEIEVLKGSHNSYPISKLTVLSILEEETVPLGNMGKYDRIGRSVLKQAHLDRGLLRTHGEPTIELAMGGNSIEEASFVIVFSCHLLYTPEEIHESLSAIGCKCQVRFKKEHGHYSLNWRKTASNVNFSDGFQDKDKDDT